MKIKIIILFLLAGFSGQLIYGQQKSDPQDYYNKMKTNLYTLYKANTFQTFKLIAGKLEKIALEEESKWIPYYHATYAYIMAGFLSQEKFEAEELLNKAQAMLDKANELHPYNSEIIALQGFIYQARIRVNPEARSKEYLPKAVKEFDQARFLDKNNPRPYYLIGQILFRIPKEYGGNKENACKHFQQAAERFKTYQPKSEFSPNWGEESNKLMLEKCK